MGVNIERLLSHNAKSMRRSEIRELLKLTQQPDIISFAGGLPAPDTFPIETIKEMTVKVLDEMGRSALQYGPTEGIPMLVEELGKLMQEDGVQPEKTKKENILVTTASQQGLDLVGKVFIDEGDTIIIEDPSYVGALGAFRNYNAKMEMVTLDENGIRTDELEEKIKEVGAENIKFIYVIPDFQNPSGVTLSLERRKELLDIASKYDLLIIEDSPYRMIRFRGDHLPSLYEMDNEGRVVALFTFSKILVPGFRLGWMAGPSVVIDKMVVAKQAMDLCTPPFNQYVTAYFLKEGKLGDVVKETIKLYEKKNKLMLDLLDKYMPKDKGVTWTKPDGGLFLWITLPDHIDTRELFKKAIEKKVAYVVGSAFYPNAEKVNSMRLNFSYPSFEDIEEGMKRLGEVINEAL